MKKLTISLLLLINSIAINVYSQTVSLDKTFGQNGRTIIPNTSEISLFDFDNNGNIIAVGYTLTSGGGFELTIIKTNDNGIIDESFGNGGVVKVTEYHSSFPRGLKITSDNKIIVIGSFTKIQFQGYETIIMRFNDNGSIDKDFGNSGIINMNFNTGDLVSLNCENDNYMFLGKREGEILENNGNLYYILSGYSISKYNYSGELDENFGEKGKVYLPNYILPYCIKILNNGSIVIAGTYDIFPNTELGFCKLTPAGELDTDFADGGIWHMNIMQDFDLAYESFLNILEDSKGDFILSGMGHTNYQKAFLNKFSSNGVLDTSFGENGFYCFDLYGSNKPIFQIGDKYITTGLYNNSYIISYVNNDGSSGDYVYSGTIQYLQDMKLQGANKIVLGGGSKNNDTNFALERVIVSSGISTKLNSSASNDPIFFPNPAKEILYFANETAFEILDIQGRVLLKSTNPVKSVNIGNLGAGIYFIRFGDKIKKFVKE